MKRTRSIILTGLLAGSGLAVAPGALAQSLPYQVGSDDGAAASDAEGAAPRSGHSARGAGSGVRTTIRPYLEVTQNLLAQITPGNDVVTYTTLAAGVDATLAGRRTQGQISVRYERRFVEKGRVGDSDTISGMARVSHQLVPRTLSIEAGGLAARTRVEANGSATLNPLSVNDAVSQVYSVYAGPALTTHAGEVAINANYLAGYTKLTQKNAYQPAAGQPRVDLFNHSVVQSAQVSAGTKAGTVLPVGLTASAGWDREDISNLDQRIDDKRVGLQATLPVSRTVQLVGDVGWEHIRVSSRDALRDASGNAVVGSDGRYVTDTSKPRQIAYDSNGLTWDVGVMWRPSRRTSLSAFVGRRYDSTTYFGSFSYAPNTRSSFNISVYDGISGFGSSLSNALKQVPTDFATGGASGCGIGATGGSCVNGALSSVSSSVFRQRGVSATYGFAMGRLRLGVGAGYVRRRFIAAPGTVLAQANGTVDQSWYVTGGVSGQLGRDASFSVAVYDAWYDSGTALLGNTNSYGIYASYYRRLADRLTATASVGLDGVSRDLAADQLEATGLIGLRYTL
ncbi:MULTISPECIES: preprotein translocase subunit YajC [unclassified Novosphingobium]|uniref:preprotein translocase subunit YajC n=1 Tax=unclassified Novosphingobium TaxID=2644732 RepID=UPI00146C7FF6|nr:MULTISPECIES: preprotein translocase subunit YajC [unclassified Novosphingobium]NMN03665.1 hypothetical protein [Novosphingobium sp. SG919]NMN86345.1 hypothetical protein [Novosphingobium sp. SG916]